MFLIMIGLLFFSMGKCARLMLTRRRLPREQRPLIDLFCAYNAMYFGAATFEGIMLGRSSSTQTMMLMFAGIGVWLTEAVSHAAPHPADDEPHHAGHDLADPHASDEYGFAVQ
jgi:hypothetical protein